MELSEMSFNDAHPNFKELRSIISERRMPIIFWVGAGASADAGLPG
jgi:NAD-dependent SIR2 family protein deacetylase